MGDILRNMHPTQRILLTGLVLLTGIPAVTFAQQEAETNGPVVVITGPEEVRVGRTIVLDAWASRNLGNSTEFRWYRGASTIPISRSVEAVFTPDKPGVVSLRLEISTVIGGKRVVVEGQKSVTVYERNNVL